MFRTKGNRPITKPALRHMSEEWRCRADEAAKAGDVDGARFATRVSKLAADTVQRVRG